MLLPWYFFNLWDWKQQFCCTPEMFIWNSLHVNLKLAFNNESNNHGKPFFLKETCPVKAQMCPDQMYSRVACLCALSCGCVKGKRANTHIQSEKRSIVKILFLDMQLSYLWKYEVCALKTPALSTSKHLNWNEVQLYTAWGASDIWNIFKPFSSSMLILGWLLFLSFVVPSFDIFLFVKFESFGRKCDVFWKNKIEKNLSIMPVLPC